jgi:putative ABC transport system permease protein
MTSFETVARTGSYALRRLRRAPARTAATLLTLALGIGATTLIFTLAYGVLFRPLPFHEPERLVALSTRTEAGRTAGVSLPDLDDWRHRASAFAAATAYTITDATLEIQGGTDAMRLAVVSDDFFTVFDAPPAAGRLLSAADSRAAAVVLAWRAWRDRFAADPDVVGHAVRINGAAMTVVGIASPRMTLPSADVEAFAPLDYVRQTAPPQWNMRGFRAFDAAARLREGVTVAAADAELARIAQGLAAEFPRFSRGTSASVRPLRSALTQSVRGALRLLALAVGLLLAIACANAAFLSLIAAASEREEWALRRALGASGRRIVLEHLTGSVLVAGAAAAGGIVLAFAGREVLAAIAPRGLPRLDDVRTDRPVLAFAIGASLVTVAIATIAPALVSARRQPAAALVGTRLTSGRWRRRVERGLASAQLALALVLLVATGVLVERLTAMMTAPTGTADAVVTARLGLAPEAYAAATAQQRFMARVIDELDREPGTTAALISSLPPATAEMQTTITPISSGSTEPVAVDVIAVTPGAFDVLGIPLIAGRGILDSDTAGSTPVAIISGTAARRLFGDSNPLGRTVPFGMSGAAGPVVVGVAGDVRYRGLDAAPGASLYLPAAQRPFRTQYVVVRAGDSTAAVRRIVETVRQVDPGVAVSRIRSFSDLRAEATAAPRFRTLVFGSITVVAVLLAAIGLYGVVTQGALGRLREFGIRIAFGATRRDIVRHVLGEALGVAAAGVTAGLALSVALQRIAASAIDGLPGPDLRAAGAAVAVLGVLVLLSAGAPAWRASRVAPAETLRR